MAENILLNLNWVDILILCIVVRMIYSGSKSNIGSEFLSLVWVALATFVILHYYARLGEWLHKAIFLPTLVQDLMAFILIWLSVYILLKIILQGWNLIFKVEAAGALNQWGGAILGAVQGVFVCGLIFVFLLVAGNDYLRKMAKQSFTGFYLVDFSPKVYRLFFDGLVVKFFPQEELNEGVFHLGEEQKKEPKNKKGKKRK